MRPSTLFVSAALVLQLVACSSTSAGTGTGSGTGGGGVATASSCDSACGYYLQCKGIDGPTNRAQCNQDCATRGYTEQQLTDFRQMDCAQAVAAIEGTGSTSGSATSGSSGTTAKDCKGCVWDGSSCIYLTGSGGNYFACDRSCCP